MSTSSRASRRRIPWGPPSTQTPLQKFISTRYVGAYQERHPDLTATGEVELLNSYTPDSCPYCESEAFRKFGLDSNGVQRYQCLDCRHTFTITTGTIFQDHKISISEWIESILNMDRYLSINADSWNNRNAFSTSRYWLEKLFIVLENAQKGVLLDDVIWMDETYYPVRSEDIQLNEYGEKLHGISRNQMCIGVACTREKIFCAYLGLGKPSSEQIWDAFSSPIVPGSKLIHDKEKAHRRLVTDLNLDSEEYDSRDLKGLPDNKNPLRRVNQVHARLKDFLNAHRSFHRDTLQGYLDLFCFAMNPPLKPLLKVELLTNRAIKCRKTLKYRDFYNVST